MSIAPEVSISTVNPSSQRSAIRSNARFCARGSPPVNSTSVAPDARISSRIDWIVRGAPSRNAYSVSQ